MLHIFQARIDDLIQEDVPYIDLTCEVLGIDRQAGRMEYFTRETCVLSGTPFAKRIAESLGCHIVSCADEGSDIKATETFMVVEGAAGALHQMWKVGLNIFDHCSAIATKTRAMVDAVHGANPRCEVLTTRKSQPGAKDMLTCAIRAGGAWPHRLGLSETVLVFAHHIEFIGGFDAFVAKLSEIKGRCVEKKLFVEADAEQALVLAEVGVDGIQLDKVAINELAGLVEKLRGINPNLTLIAAGGINLQNAAEYAATGVDGIATTAPFNAKPLDMSVRMGALY